MFSVWKSAMIFVPITFVTMYYLHVSDIYSLVLSMLDLV